MDMDMDLDLGPEPELEQPPQPIMTVSHGAILIHSLLQWRNC
jgi:hypothetical protein